MANPFETLGVPGDCTLDELRKAYRALARRWHPDRFMEGPEREWALQHMIAINTAYADCCARLNAATAAAAAEGDLDHIQSLIQCGRLSEARRALLKQNARCARWNHLFGVVLHKQGETDKALTYLNMAVRQAPTNETYRRSRDDAEKQLSHRKITHLLTNLLPKR